jgi:hypothetical protein
VVIDKGMKLTPFVEKVSEADYDRIPALRSSLLKEFMKSPAHYKWAIDNPDKSDAAHFVIGSLVHAMLLEPDEVAKKFVKCDMKTRHNKEFYALKSQVAPRGMQIALAHEWADAERMVNNALDDFHIRKLMDTVYAEITAVSQVGGVWCKCRIDGFLPEEQTIIDIKTTGDTVYWFPHNLRKFGYEISAPYYVDITSMAGSPITKYQFVVIEKKPPFAAKIFTMSNEYLSSGRTRYMEALGRFKKCLDTNEWKGYDNSCPDVLYPPALVKEQLINEAESADEGE